jgi:hypothetical protein
LWARRVTLLAGTPPGTYKLYGAVFDINDPTRAPVSVLDAEGNNLAPRFELGTLTVLPPTRAITIESLPRLNPAPLRFSAGVTLWGATLDRAEANAGDTILVNLFWKAEKDLTTEQNYSIELSDNAGQKVLTQAETLAALTVGEVRRAQIRVRLPAGLANGGYRWGIKVNGESRGASLGEIQVTAPVRAFIAPSFNQKVGVQFSDFAELVGYSWRENKLVLVWEARKTTEVSYSVFVHVARGERVWAQSDGVPQNWSRPTTGWLADEFITDERVLTLPVESPVGEYEIFVGWVDALNGKRVTERIKIGTLIK